MKVDNTGFIPYCFVTQYLTFKFLATSHTRELSFFVPYVYFIYFKSRKHVLNL